MRGRGWLVWDSWNKSHIKKHQVAISEVEEAYSGEIVESKSYLGRKVIFVRTRERRGLTIVVSPGVNSRHYVISARDMSKKERRLYEQETRTEKAL